MCTGCITIFLAKIWLKPLQFLILRETQLVQAKFNTIVNRLFSRYLAIDINACAFIVHELPLIKMVFAVCNEEINLDF